MKLRVHKDTGTGPGERGEDSQRIQQAMGDFGKSSKNKDNVWRVSEVYSIFDHHTDYIVFTTRPRVTTTQIRNLPVDQNMVRNHPDISTPSFVQTVMDTVGVFWSSIRSSHAPDVGNHETTEVITGPLTITRLRLPLFP